MSRLAAPVLAEETLTLMVTWTDWWLTGRYLAEGGDAIKAAMGLMGYTMWLIPSLFAAVAIGATAVVARRVGEMRLREAQIATNQAVLIGALLALIVTAVGWFFGEAFIAAMQLRDDAAAYSKSYLYIVVLVTPMIMFEQVGAACLRGAGDMVTGFIAKSLVVIVNVVVSTTLVIGMGGIDSWGWQGIAIGTAAGHAVGGSVLLMALLAGRANMKLKWSLMAPRGDVIRRLLMIGLPGGVDVGLILFSQLIFVAVINSLGKSAAAAHGLAVQIEACAFLPAHAFAVAAATIAGQFLGAGKPDRAVRGALACIMAAMGLITVTGVMMFLFGRQMSALFTGDVNDPTTIQAAQLLRIVAIALPSLAIVMVASGALRGAGDTIWPLAITLLGFFSIRIPLAIFLAKDQIELPLIEITVTGAGWGVTGAWIAMAIDLVVRSILVAARFLHGGWKRLRI